MTRHQLYLIKLGDNENDLEDFNKNEQDDYKDDFDEDEFPDDYVIDSDIPDGDGVEE